MPTILRNLRITRVASVDKGAGDGVEIVLMKRGIGKFAVPGLPHPHAGHPGVMRGGRGRSISPGQAQRNEARQAGIRAPRRAGPSALRSMMRSQARASKPGQKHEPGTSSRPGPKTTRTRKADAMSQVDDSLYEAICKRTFTAQERKDAEAKGYAMPGGRYPINDKKDLENAIHAVGRGKGSHAAIRAHIMARAKALGATDMIPDDWKAKKRDGLIAKLAEFFHINKDASDGDARDFAEVYAGIEAREVASDMLEDVDEAVCALRITVNEIMCDEETTDKAAAIEESFQQFREHMAGLMPDELEKFASAIVAKALTAGSAGTTDNEGVTMSVDLKKALGLPADAKDADVEKMLGEVVEGAAFGAAVEKMSAKHTAFMNNDKAKMPSGGKKAFASMSPDERDAHMSKNPVEDEEEAKKRAAAQDEVLKLSDGSEVRKSAVGAATFDVLKRQEARIAEGEDIRKRGEIAKRVEPLVNIGKADEIATLLHGIGKHDAKLAESVETMFKALNERIAKGKLFEEAGSGQSGVTSAMKAITAKAEELRKADPKLTIEKARMRVRAEHPELAKAESQEQEEQQRRNRAA